MSTKRIISGLLALVMTLGCVPVTVMAEEVPLVLEAEVMETAAPETTMAEVTEKTTEAPEEILMEPLVVTEEAALATADGIAIDETNFPDEVFRNYISEIIDADEDALLSKEEISDCTHMYIGNKGITSLKGIEHFNALTDLYCSRNRLTKLDVSNNTALTYLDCSYNDLTKLDIDSCTALTTLSCHYNQLTTLDVSSCTALTKLNCEDNQLTKLDVCNNTALINLNCDINQLTELDVTRNTALIFLYCTGNQLTELDISNNTALQNLYCGSNKLTVLNVKKHIALSQLSCYENQLTSLDLSTCTKLNSFGSCSNQSYPISVDGNKTFNLETLPGNFSVDKASDWTGGTVSGTILTVASNATSVSYTYDCGNGDSMSVSLPIIYISAPTVTIANRTSDGKPTLIWTAVNGAVKYQIWRSKTGKVGSFGLINTVNALTTTNTSAVAGTKYYYKIRAVYSDGTKSNYSSVVTITCDLPRPTGLKVTNLAASGKNRVTWNAVNGAAKYEVWYSETGKTGSYKRIWTTKYLYFNHNGGEAGQKYFYKVKAIHSNSAANSAFSGSYNRTCDLAKPTGVKVTAAATGKNKISWTAVPGAAKYQVWFSKTGKVGSFTLLTTKNASALTHTHAKGVAGQKYFYKVKAIHTNTNANSAWSAVVNRISQ